VKGQRLVRKVLEFTVVFLLLAGCATLVATSKPTTAPTFTPDPCTGWWCSVSGTVYAEMTGFGNELESVTVTLLHSSYCSPTRGQHQTTTSPEGRFEFSDVYFHDTDRIRTQVETKGYELAQWDSVDTYCLFFGCPGSPLEIVLEEDSGPW
jgi:hypothetical protein